MLSSFVNAMANVLLIHPPSAPPPPPPSSTLPATLSSSVFEPLSKEIALFLNVKDIASFVQINKFMGTTTQGHTGVWRLKATELAGLDYVKYKDQMTDNNTKFYLNLYAREYKRINSLSFTSPSSKVRIMNPEYWTIDARPPIGCGETSSQFCSSVCWFDISQTVMIKRGIYHNACFMIKSERRDLKLTYEILTKVHVASRRVFSPRSNGGSDSNGWCAVQMPSFRIDEDDEIRFRVFRHSGKWTGKVWVDCVKLNLVEF